MPKAGKDIPGGNQENKEEVQERPRTGVKKEKKKKSKKVEEQPKEAEKKDEFDFEEEEI